MSKISRVKRLSISLVFMMISALLTAQIISILPNDKQVQLKNRRLLTENLANQLTRYTGRQPLSFLESLLNTVKQEHDDISSLAIRNRTGLLLIEIGEHGRHWDLRVNDPSTANQLQIPLHAGETLWGNLELRFEPLGSTSIFGLSINNSILLILFIAVVGFLLFGGFLRKALHYFEPGSVIPDRVKNAMDIISEGILILDEQERIMLVNPSLAEQIGVPPEKLIGKTPEAMQWDRRKPNQKIPWQEAQKTNKRINDIHMYLRTKHFGVRSFLVTAAPIAAEKSKARGTMVTFKDVTQLQRRNKQLNSAVHTLRKSQAEVRKKNQELAILASRDPLTGCLNRRAFFEIAESRLAALLAKDQPATCIMLDVDYFKSVNDKYGHSIGDIVLKRLSTTIIACLRKNDLPCRYGGEEFAIYLDNTSIEQAYLLAERIRKEIEHIDFDKDPATRDLKITSSFGLADNRFGASTLEAIIDQADQALYYSKDHGRNRVSIWKEIKPMLEKEKSNIEQLGSQHGHVIGRPLFTNILQQACIDCGKNHCSFTTLLIDIDMFKRVNNTIGHHGGDDLLIQIQNRIEKLLDHETGKSLIGKDNIYIDVVNLKGDEYGVIIPGLGDPEAIHNISQYIMQNINRPFDIGTHEINLTCSIGSNIFPHDANNPEHIMRNIELAVARAKEHGGNYHQAYEEELDIASEDESIIESKLQSALQNDELFVCYQPKIEFETGRITGFEALARWHNPQSGDISPSRFIPVAEQSGLINEVGLWVLKTACTEAKQWIDSGFEQLRIAVNLSVTQLKKYDFPEQIQAIFDETGFDPHNLELEVTESTIMENIDTVTPVLYQLSEKGVAITIDDFGVGYSSLNYIKRFPLSAIKIDRSLVMNIIEDQDDESIVRAIIAMAHALNLEVVAEGVETMQHLRLLQQMNCDQLQGFVFSRPISAEDAIGLLHENNNNASELFGPKMLPNKN